MFNRISSSLAFAVCQSCRFGTLAVLACATLGPNIVFAQPAAPPPPLAETGIWIDDTGKGAVEILPCGDTGKAKSMLCGRIVWLKEPNDSKGKPLFDGYNPNVSLRSRPICGLQVLGNLQRQSPGVWDIGWVYDPKVGQSYDVEIRLSDRDRLTVTGYKGMKLFSKTFSWTRAPVGHPRCDAATIIETRQVIEAPKKAIAVPPEKALPNAAPAKKAVIVPTTKAAPATVPAAKKPAGPSAPAAIVAPRPSPAIRP